MSTRPGTLSAPPDGGPGLSDDPAQHPCYLYGILSRELAAAALDDLPPGCQFVYHRELAGLIRPVPPPPHRPTAQLLGYADTLDRLAATGPVLPIRFGTILATPTAVATEVLALRYDTYTAALAALTGLVQLVLRMRYRPDAVVREVLAEQPRLARLHQRVRRQPPGRDGAGRLQLGELVAAAVAGKRSPDLAAVVETVREHAARIHVVPDPGTDPERVGDVVCLVARSRISEFEAAAATLAHRWRERARLQVLGPMAAYHFADELATGTIGGPTVLDDR